MVLQYKILRVVLLILLISAIVSGVLMFFSVRQTTMLQFRQMAIMLGNTLEGSLKQGMMTGIPEITQQAIHDIGEQKMVTGVSLLTPSGTTVASSMVSEIGNKIDNEEILRLLQTGDVSIGIEKQRSRSEIWIIDPVVNQPECQGCHDSNAKVLGGIRVGLDATTLNNQATQLTIFLGFLGGVTFIIIGGSLAVAIRKTVLVPLFALAATARNFSQGNFAIRAKSDYKDEIGMLSRTFNHMAESVEQRSQELETSHRELASLNMDLEHKVEQRTNQLAALNAIITAVSQSLDLRRILDAALDKTLSLLELDAGVIYLLESKSGQTLSAQQGFLPESVQRLSTAGTRDEVTRQPSETIKPLIVNDTILDVKSAPLEGVKGEFRSYAIIPIDLKGTALGAISVASYTPNKFEPEVMGLLLSISEAIGIAAENALAAQHIAEMNTIREQLLKKLISAQEEERRRIARELHDDASQSLAALVLQLDEVSDTLPARLDYAKKKIDVLREQTVKTLNAVRDLALELRPSALDDLGLTKALDWYAKRYFVKSGVDVKVETSGTKTKLPQYAETQLFRVAQEAMANAIRHAEASQVKIQLIWGDSRVKLVIEDNGKGFNLQKVLNGETHRQHLGIHSMSERVTLVGGILNVDSQPGKGTRVAAEIPFMQETN